MGKFKFPSAYTILFILIALVAVMTWIVPAGKYQMAMNATLGKEVPVAGTYAPTEAHPQGLTAVLLAPIDGLYNHETYTAGAIDVALFVLIIGGFLGVDPHPDGTFRRRRYDLRHGGRITSFLHLIGSGHDGCAL